MSKKEGSSTTVEPTLTPPSTTIETPLTPPSTTIEPSLTPPSTTMEPSLTQPSTIIEPPLTPPTTTVGQSSQPPTPYIEPDEPEIMEAIQQALALVKNGEHKKALNLINKSISNHHRLSRLLFAKGGVHLSLAAANDDSKAKHLEDGIRSAQLLAELVPDCPQSARLLDDLHKELAVFNKESESDPTDLAIESPTDYGMADLFGEDLSKESRFEDDVKKEDNEATERRKKQSKAIMKKLKDNNEDISNYMQFWNSITLSDEQKRGFRKVNIEKLVNHIKSLEDQLAVDLLLEAIDFAKQHKTWTFWECYDCVMKLFGGQFWLEHCKGSRSVWKLDAELWKESTDMIEKGVWKPFDTNEVIKLKSDKGLDKCKSDDKGSSKTSMHGPKWAFCDDIERSRTVLLRRIRGIFFLLHKSKFLSPSLVHWALEYAKDQFESIIPLSQFKDLGLKRLQVIWFLGAPQLTEMFTFLEDVVHTCGLSENVELGRSMDDKLSDHRVFDIKERVLFSRDFTCLLVDERALQGKLNATNYFDEVAGDGSAVSLSAIDVVPVCDDIVSWLYTGSSCGEGLKSWNSLIESCSSQAVKSHKVFLEKLKVIPQTSATNDKIPSKLRAIQKLENLLLEDIEKDKSPENESQLYTDLLKKCQKELKEIEDTSKRSELDAISEILEKAKEVESGDQSGYEGCSAEEESRMQEGSKQRINCIKIALKQLKMQLFKQLSCHDVINLRRAVASQQHAKELTNKTVCDYRSIVVPMLKSFLQSHLKDLYEDAKEKSKAAEEALLAEMALEADKDYAETSKESEETDGSEHFELHQKDVELSDSKNDDSLDEQKQSTTAEEARMLDEYLENQRRHEHEAHLKVNVSGSGNEAAEPHVTLPSTTVEAPLSQPSTAVEPPHTPPSTTVDQPYI